MHSGRFTRTPRMLAMSPIKALAVVAALVLATTQATSHAEARGLRLGLGFGLPLVAAIAAASIHERQRTEAMQRRAAIAQEARTFERARQAQAAKARAAAKAAALAEANQLEIARKRNVSRIAEATRQSAPHIPAANTAVAASAPAPFTAAPTAVQEVVSSSGPIVPVQKTANEMCQRFLPTAGVTIAVPCGE